MFPPRDQPSNSYDNLIVIGTSDGNVKLVDLARNKILNNIQMKGGQECSVFSVAWNIEGYLAIASTDKSVLVKKFDAETKTFFDVTQLATNCESRTVAWNPIKPNILAAGLFNG